jgi:hypothetical protein
MLAKKLLLKNDTFTNTSKEVSVGYKASSGSKEPFRVGRYLKGGGKTEKENDTFDAKSTFITQNKNGKYAKGGMSSKKLYIVREEKYTTSYHSFNSLENINLPSQTFESSQEINPKIANIKSRYDNEGFFEKSSNKFFDDSFISEKTDFLMDDVRQFCAQSEIFDENEENNYRAMAEKVINEKAKAEGSFNRETSSFYGQTLRFIFLLLI